MESTTLVVGSASAARVEIRPLARSHAGATDYWDGNWIDCEVSASAGGFRAQYVACLRAEEFVGFRRCLKELYRDLEGLAQFKSMEEWLRIEVSGDGRGHFKGPCHLRDRAGGGNVLAFEIEFDQTEIPAMMDQLALIERAFPVVGK
jgi:hypothetical protein